MSSRMASVASLLLALLSLLPVSEQSLKPMRGHLLRKTDPNYRTHSSLLGLPNRRRFSFGVYNSPFGSGDPFEMPIFQSRPRFLVWKTEHLKPWSKWSGCRSKSCRKIRFRQCLEMKKCPADFLVETKSCKDATGCDPQAFNVTIADFNGTCGERPEGLKMKIIGGKEAKPHSWPWQGGLLMGNKENTAPTCGATLISPQWAVTAAHCLAVSYWPEKIPRGRPFRPSSISPMRVSVVFGDHHTQQRDHPEQVRQVIAVVIHNKFVLRNDYCSNDVALLKLDKPIEMSEQISTACLPPASLMLKAGTHCTALGWGVVRVVQRVTSFMDWFRPPKMIRASVLQEVSLPLVSYQDCLKHFPSSSIKPDVHLCAGERGKDTCRGDSGGPLMCSVETKDGQRRWFLYGITSFGSQVKCGRSYGVYSRVSEFSSWMQKMMRLV